MNVLIANYGNASLAMIQWAIETKLDKVVVLSVDTGWQSSHWQTHLTHVFNFLENKGIAFQHLNSQKTFEECVIDRGSFPSKKFQWCASFLKGLPLNDALDVLDIHCKATLHLAKMRVTSRANQSLLSGEISEHYQDRALNYPLLADSFEERDALIKRAGFDVMAHNSQECMPCIHADKSDWQRMSAIDVERLTSLQTNINQKMFIEPLSNKANDNTQHYDMGCGNVWGCGE
tara:strand:- start:1138 stop:1833 length:696 start_codon:yes stop_codon:yes gene_type:complete